METAQPRLRRLKVLLIFVKIKAPGVKPTFQSRTMREKLSRRVEVAKIGHNSNLNLKSN